MKINPGGKFGHYQSRTYPGSWRKGKDLWLMGQGKFNQTDEGMFIRLVLSRKGDQRVIKGLSVH